MLFKNPFIVSSKVLQGAWREGAFKFHYRESHRNGAGDGGGTYFYFVSAQIQSYTEYFFVNTSRLKIELLVLAKTMAKENIDLPFGQT